MEDYTKYLCIATEKELQFVKNLLNIEPNDISLLYFSKNNIEYLNAKIVDIIYGMTREKLEKPIKIQKQKEQYLLERMRYIYFDDVRNTSPTNIEVEHLNKRFLESIIPNIYSELISYLKYLDEINQYQSSNIPINENPISSRKRKELKPLSTFFDF